LTDAAFVSLGLTIWPFEPEDAEEPGGIGFALERAARRSDRTQGRPHHTTLRGPARRQSILRDIIGGTFGRRETGPGMTPRPVPAILGVATTQEREKWKMNWNFSVSNGELPSWNVSSIGRSYQPMRWFIRYQFETVRRR
jgi:hypothetical protein